MKEKELKARTLEQLGKLNESLKPYDAELKITESTLGADVKSLEFWKNGELKGVFYLYFSDILDELKTIGLTLLIVG